MSFQRLGFVVGAVLLVCLFSLRARLIAVRVFDPDEFEHAHVSLQIAQGKTVYRDFFEHHGPLPYYLAAVFPAVIGNREELLFCNRLPSLFLTLTTLICVYRTGCRLRGPGTGLIACLWLESMPWFVEKSVEWRPDVPAMCFVTLAAARLLDPNFKRRDGFVVGLLLGVASLCTLKVITLALWLSIGFSLCRWQQRRPFVVPITYGVFGGIFAWLPFFAWFAWRGALPVFVDCVLLLPFRWEAVEPFRDFYTTFPSWAPGHVALAIWGLASCWRNHWRLKDWLTGPTAFAFAATVHFAMLPFVPASFLQYHLLALPISAIVIATSIADRLTASTPTLHTWRSNLAFPLFVGTILSLNFAAGGYGSLNRWRPIAGIDDLGRVFHLGDFSSQLEMLRWFSALDCALILLAFCGLFATALSTRRFLWLACFLLALPGLTRIGNQHLLMPNHSQLEDIRTLRRFIGPDAVVLDGFTGIGWQNPHALYWWWINPHTEWLMRKRGEMVDLGKCIDEGKADLVVFDKVWNNDKRMKTVYETVMAPLGNRYVALSSQPQAFWCMLFLRSDFRLQSTPESN